MSLHRTMTQPKRTLYQARVYFLSRNKNWNNPITYIWYTRGVYFWCRKVFEGVQKHVFDFLRIHSFGAEYWFESAPKVVIRTIINASKLLFHTWSLISERKMHQNCNIREKTSNQVSIWILKLLWSTGFEKLVCWSCYNCALISKRRVRLMISST